MTINKVIPAQAESGDGMALQPAAPLTDEVRTQLFDEFAVQPLPAGEQSFLPVIAGAAIVAVVLAGIAVYIVRQVKPHDPV